MFRRKIQFVRKSEQKSDDLWLNDVFLKPMCIAQFSYLTLEGLGLHITESWFSY